MKRVSLFIFLLLLLRLNNLSAQSIFLFGNRTISTCDAFILDADSMRGNYPAGTFVMTVNSATGARLGINFEVSVLNTNDNDSIWVYDGPNTSAPVMFYSPSPISTPAGNTQTSGSSLTIKLKAAIQGVTPRKFKIRVRCVSDPQNVPSFIPAMRHGWGGNIQLGDYDNDGDKDMLIGGEVYRNDQYLDSFYMFDRRFDVLGKWTTTKMLAHDFDSDGDKDVFITGATNVPGPFGPYASLYRNNGNGTLTRVTTQSFANAYSGACSLVDFNKDGKQDICYTGRTNLSGTPVTIFKVYLNNGGMSFTDANVSLPGITGLISASISWADSDADGDEDLLVSGISNAITTTRFFTVNGASFTQQAINFTNISSGQTIWVDVNKDGKPDIVNAGVQTPGNVDAIVPELFMNNGGNSFTRIATNIPAWASVNQDWTDYDFDGDMDMVMSGSVINGGAEARTGVFRNNGSGNFTRIGVDSAKGYSTVKWITLNGDNRPDLFIGGNHFDYSYFLKNMGNDSFRIASYPMPAFIQKGQMLVEDFTNDGKPDVLMSDVMEGIDCSADYNSIMIDGIDWRLSGISKFSRVAALYNLVSQPITTSYGLYWKWGHYDTDGLLDILLIDQESYPFGPYIAIFRSNGNNSFTKVFDASITGLPGSWRNNRDAALVDLDNDGTSELFVTGNSVFKKSGNTWITYYETPGCNDPLACNKYHVDFGDFDNDGFKDAVISRGTHLLDDGMAYVLRNDGTGKLVTYVNLLTRGSRQGRWYDFDKDGDLDIVVGRFTHENRNGEFIPVWGGLREFIHTGIGDFNGDGWDDMVSVVNNFSNAFYPGSFFYNEQGTFYYKEISAVKLYQCDPTGWEDAIEAFDADSDGDIDIPQTAGGLNCGSGMLINLYNVRNKSISLWSPNGGEVLTIGTIHTIRWLGNQLGPAVKLEISRDNGVSWQIISSSTPTTATGGSFLWVVNGPAAEKCLVRITDIASGNIVDISNATFRITITTSVGSVNQNYHVPVYPNPTNKSLYVGLPAGASRTVAVTIYDAAGTLIHNKQMFTSQGQSLTIDVEKFSKGMYFLKIADKNKTYLTKFLKM